jgi:hypothetical protein
VGTEPLTRGDRVEYLGAPVFDGIIDTGEIGWVTKVERGWVHAVWPRSGVHSVPLDSVRLLPPEVTRVVTRAANAQMWGALGEELPSLSTGRPRDPYINQGCHPDVVSRVWDQLGKELPRDCRAQANGKPVLAHPDTDRIIAFALGTAYALWFVPADFDAARAAGASTVMNWSGGSSTDLALVAGAGWSWGRWSERESGWLLNAYALDERSVFSD